MKMSNVIALVALAPVFGSGCHLHARSEDLAGFPVLQGHYLGQSPPGTEPRLFAPGIVSTAASEFGATFSPDGTEFFFAVSGAPFDVVLSMTLEDGRWTRPRVAPFSGRYDDFDMNFSPDGESLFFTSRRPLSGRGEPRSDNELWVVSRTRDGWSEPRNLGTPINTAQRESYASATRDGTLYFHRHDTEKGDSDIFRTRYSDGAYAEPERLGPAVNTKHIEWDAFISPDENYLIFGSVGRPDGFGACDLYISFRNPDGTWTSAVNMGEKINSSAHEFTPSVSPDGEYLFFMSGRRLKKNYSDEPITYQDVLDTLNGPGNGRGDIYWVDAGVIENLRPKP